MAQQDRPKVRQILVGVIEAAEAGELSPQAAELIVQILEDEDSTLLKITEDAQAGLASWWDEFSKTRATPTNNFVEEDVIFETQPDVAPDGRDGAGYPENSETIATVGAEMAQKRPTSRPDAIGGVMGPDLPVPPDVAESAPKREPSYKDLGLYGPADEAMRRCRGRDVRPGLDYYEREF